LGHFAWPVSKASKPRPTEKPIKTHTHSNKGTKRMPEKKAEKMRLRKG